ncbi:phosphodiesterase [Mycolicibacterium flavescens]|uniref:Phosphodiesterase n=1 Tax=Mycolicibacterium flavescens TaxID=1776 RepID=A0A1E3RES7_MYCFV|nr:phosphodiesterase [Mycolicibacterium flavescens]MCV7280893.1 phosphodiesterase [Mycolicibacterium flavescens]ODQ88385.1 phosphodiesterase [Mycolicibacterium flavescens]
MQASDIAALPIRFGAALRSRRLFHPSGVMAEGILERVAPEGDGLPMQSCDILARVSKGVGLPGAAPDVAGLAWRIPPPPDLRSCGPWDVLLASTLAGSRIALAPAASWTGATFSSLMPLRYHDRLWWVRARLASGVDGPGLSLAAIEEAIATTNVTFAVDQAPSTGGFRPLARLTLRHVDPSCDDIAFDPAMHSDPEVELAPRWLGDFRRSAYRRSRQGREAE